MKSQPAAMFWLKANLTAGSESSGQQNLFSSCGLLAKAQYDKVKHFALSAL